MTRMNKCGWPIRILLLHLLRSALSVSIPTSAPPIPSHISPSSIPPPFPVGQLHTTPALPSSHQVDCSLRMEPSSVVVRFGDPVRVNCSSTEMTVSVLGWEGLQTASHHVVGRFLVWNEDRITNWSISPKCYALSDEVGQCHRNLPVTVYKPPESVSVSFKNHLGPLREDQLYLVQCEVKEVAPVQNLAVVFYRDQVVLQKQSSNSTENSPVTESFKMDYRASREDHGARFWCEARLELGPEGPQSPPVVRSHNMTATVLFGPQILCADKVQLTEGQRLSCEVRGNPSPSVTWIRDGQVITPPTRSRREDAGKYTVSAWSHLGQKQHTVEVEVCSGAGNITGWIRHFLLTLLLIPMGDWL